MSDTIGKPLQPLSYGSILLVGVKASNLDEEIRNHPRVTIWDSQHEHWISKDLPSATRAVFITRFIGHAAFRNILAEARKRQITIFNPDGTGNIVRQVRELLSIKRQTMETTPVRPTETKVTSEELMEKQKVKKGKLNAIIHLIDFNKTNKANAEELIKTQVGSTSTLASLANWVGVQRKRRGTPNPYRTRASALAVPRASTTQVDASVEILDEMVKTLQDMRDFLVATTEENKSLKTKLAQFRKLVND